MHPTTPPAAARCRPLLVAAAALAAGAGAAAGQAPDGTAPQGCTSGWSAASLPTAGTATRPPAERAGLDVLAYDLALDLTGAGAGRLQGHAALRVRADPALDAIRLDLVGLTVDSARLDGRPASCRHDGAVLEIAPGGRAPGGGLAPGRHRVDVFYRGRPRDGLAFGTGGRGEPTAFADNWPNRARWWFPSNDHPSDKARVRFDVLAPAGHAVVANGRRVAGPVPVSGDDDVERWVWETRVPLPTYLMVVGTARFRRLEAGEAACGRAPEAAGACVPVSVWALAGDSAFAAERFRRAPDMVDVYTRLFATPFPYAKLAHVESSTRFGGMENAGAIFYARQPWADGTMGEGVIAHETVHQWFGDAVTPARWRHLWLSEGFATYFAAVYFGLRDGPEAFRSRMEEARRDYLGSDVVGRPVVDTTRDLFSLLDANSYEKGAWVLHMLRGAVGDSAFFRGVRRYLRRHLHGTARTSDLRRATEAASGRDLGWFFRQWLRQPGHPRLQAEWWTEPSPDGTGRTLVLEVRQNQPAEWPTFRLPLEIRARGGVRPDEGEATRREVTLSRREETVRIAVPGPVTEVTLDPEDRLLATVELRRRAREPVDAGVPPGPRPPR